jgi:DSBA-like thioredoxin domain
VLAVIGRIGAPPSLMIFTEGNHLMVLSSDDIVGAFSSWAKSQPQYVIHEVSDSIGLDGQELLEKAQTNEIKQRLRLQTERAIQAGVFGVPSFVVDGEIFWGNDRLHFLKEHLQGKLSTDMAKVEEILARPRAADRSRNRRIE